MSIVYNPTEVIDKTVPRRKLKKAVSKTLTLKRAALSTVETIEVVSKSSVTKIALKVLKEYKERIKKEAKESGKTQKQLAEEIAKDPKALIQRVQNEVVFEVKEQIKEKYRGEQYRWLPSDAMEPDPLHQVKYGEIYIVGDGEMPGDRFGCRCGMEILTDDEKLDL